VEDDELAHTEGAVAEELLLEGPTFRGVARREDLEGELRGSAFPALPGVEVVLGDAELDRAVGREPSLGIGGVEVDEGVARRRVLIAGGARTASAQDGRCSKSVGSIEAGRERFGGSHGGVDS